MSRLSYRFDRFRFDASAYKVTRDTGEVVDLEPKAVEVLRVLLEHPGKLVRKDELLDAVWKDTAVTPNALTRVIAQLRRALQDDAQQARIIETVPTLGYRFLPAVTPIDDTPARPVLTASPEPAEEPAAPVSAARPRRHAWAALGVVLALVGALSGWWITTRRPEPAAREAAVQISGSEHQAVHPALSPDGQQLAFVSNQGGTFEIYVQRVDRDGERPVQLTSDGRDSTHPAWSPDGHFIAFTRRNGGIWVVPAGGGSARQVAAFGSLPSWSPDGAQIAFQSEVGRSALTTSGRPGSTIWRVPVAGGTPVQVTSEGKPEGGHSYARWSPAGDRLFFIAFLNQIARVWSVGVEDGVLTEAIGTEQRGSALTSLAFGPNGELLIPWTFRRPGIPTGDVGGLAAYTIDALGNVSGEKRFVLADVPQRIGQFAISPDGRRIYYTQVGTNAKLIDVPVDQSGSPLGPGRPLDLPREWDFVNHPSISSDGKEIAFSVFANATASIWTMPFEGGRPRLLVRSEGVDAYPEWIPGTSRVINVRAQSPNTYLVETDTVTRQSRVVMTLPEATAFLQALGDGDTILANIGAPVNGVGRGSLRERRFERWTEFEGLSYPRASPDGKRTAVERPSGEGYQLWVAGPGELRRLSTAPGEHWPYSWSPDGRFIAVASQREGIWNIWVVDATTGAERPVTVQSDPALQLQYPEWSPAGGRIVFFQSLPAHRLWSAELPAEAWAK